VTDDDRVSRLARLEERSRRARGEPPPPETPVRATANVCEAAGCLSRSSDAVESALVDALVEREIADIAVKRVGCLGPCALGPLVQIAETGALFDHVDADALDPVLDGLVSGASDTSALAPYFAKQVKVVLANSGRVDPESIDDYLAEDGYEALRTVVSAMQPADVVDEVVRSGLRGRGGAGYPTGLKWQTMAKASGEGGKYVICNADEGDPGAFMDRSVLESDPQRVLEGMAIAGYAVGADHGYVYVRAEYPLAVKRLRTAIRQAEARGLLGGNVADSAFEFHVEVRLGAGAFVCGEETALIASVEGGRGTPRPRPPYPAVSGLRGRPTLINNVETFANVASIIRNGADWFRSLGTPTSAGTKVFALAGRVVNGGLIEVPMGVSLRSIVFDIGGGIPDGHRFKAVQTGGPSGGCIPEAFLDMAVDYESLASVGSIMGSGGMIVMDDSSCMVDVAKYFMDFCREESCGKCIPCRVGTVQMHGFLARITRGEATADDLAKLERLCEMVSATSLCGLGQNAANPVVSTLRYFRDEYLAHIHDRVCPAGVCPIAATGPISTTGQLR
jgi:bidirectional [NiFe] hydrogenase diaphorase subunit